MKIIWLDNNFFSDLLNNTVSKVELETITKECDSGKAIIAITPFTFLESIQGRNKLTEIDRLYKQFMKLPDFSIANIFNIFRMKESFASGKEIVNRMKMSEVLGDDPLEYAAYRDGIKMQIGEEFSKVAVNYSVYAAVEYLVCDECDDRGRINERTKHKITHIIKSSANKRNESNFKGMFKQFYLSGESKLHLHEQVLEFIKILLRLSEANEQIAESGDDYDESTFNYLLSKCTKYESITCESFKQTLYDVSKKTNNALSSKTVFERFIEKRAKNMRFIVVFYKQAIGEKLVLYKKLNNDLIDMINIGAAAVFLNGHENIYYTNDTPFLKLLKEHSNENLFGGKILNVKYKPGLVF